MEGLGLNLKGLLYSGGNFLILFAILSFFFHKYFLGMIDGRTKEIKDSLNQAEQIKKDAGLAQDEQRKLIEQARIEAGALLAEAKQQAKAMEERITSQAETRAQELLTQASQKIEQERASLKESLQEELTDLVIRATEKVLGAQVPEAVKKEHVSNLVKEMS